MRTTSEPLFAERRSSIDRRQRGLISTDAVRLLVEQMADGMLVVDRDGIIRFVNPAAATLFGRPVHELQGRPFGFPVIAGESAEIELLRPDGKALAVELRARDYDWQGKPASIISLRDITDRNALEQERLARARAEAASRAKSEFLTLMSHELRTPLNAVIGYAELLMVQGADPITSRQRSSLVRILASAQHLRDLVGEMLDLAEAGEGRLELGHTSAPATRPASQALEEARGNAQARGVVLDAGCTDAGVISFAGDERRVKQILAILLDNAIRFTAPGGTVTVECDQVSAPSPDARLRGAGPWTRWRVRDSGIGIAADQHASIFEPFVQVDAGHTREQGGSGLGLTIGRSLARLMKGDLTVESEPGRGSTFTLWLPAA